jgi:hypothetical protein
MASLDDHRQDANEALAPLLQALRSSALEAWTELGVKTLDLEPFTVVVPISTKVDVGALWRHIWQKGGEKLAQQILDEGILKQEPALNPEKADKLAGWCARNGLAEELGECTDEVAQTPRVSATGMVNHEVPPLGKPYKGK